MAHDQTTRRLLRHSSALNGSALASISFGVQQTFACNSKEFSCSDALYSALYSARHAKLSSQGPGSSPCKTGKRPTKACAEGKSFPCTSRCCKHLNSSSLQSSWPSIPELAFSVCGPEQANLRLFPLSVFSCHFSVKLITYKVDNVFRPLRYSWRMQTCVLLCDNALLKSSCHFPL